MCRAPRARWADEVRRAGRPSRLAIQWKETAMRHCAWVLFLLALFSHCTGCALREDGKKLMRISKGREPAIAPASQTGKYEVAYLLAGTHHLIHLDGTEVRVAKG